MKIILITGITLAVLLATAVAGFFTLMNLSLPQPQPIPPTAPAMTPPPPPPTETAPPPATPPTPAFEEKAGSLAQAITNVAATGKSEEVTLVFSEAEVNAQAAQMLTQLPLPPDIPLEIKSVHIDFKAENNLVLDVPTSAYGFSFTAKVKAQVSVKEGKPEVTISEVSFGAIPLPSTVKDRLVGILKQKIDEMLVQLTETGIAGEKVVLEFKEIKTQEEQITVTVIIKPKA